MNGQPDVRVLLHELLHNLGQGVSCLAMGRGNRKLPNFAVVIFLGNFSNVIDLAEDLSGELEDLFAAWSDPYELFSPAHKNVDS